VSPWAARWKTKAAAPLQVDAAGRLFFSGALDSAPSLTAHFFSPISFYFFIFFFQSCRKMCGRPTVVLKNCLLGYYLYASEPMTGLAGVGISIFVLILPTSGKCLVNSIYIFILKLDAGVHFHWFTSVLVSIVQLCVNNIVWARIEPCIFVSIVIIVWKVISLCHNFF